MSDCRWVYDEHCFKWDTSCGGAFQFIDDGPKENGMKFCPYCGRTLVAIEGVSDGDA